MNISTTTTTTTTTATTITTFNFVAEHFPAYLPFLAQQYWNSPTPTRLEIHQEKTIVHFDQGLML
jgi:hypothetical protein